MAKMEKLLRHPGGHNRWDLPVTMATGVGVAGRRLASSIRLESHCLNLPQTWQESQVDRCSCTRSWCVRRNPWGALSTRGSAGECDDHRNRQRHPGSGGSNHHSDSIPVLSSPTPNGGFGSGTLADDGGRRHRPDTSPLLGQTAIVFEPCSLRMAELSCSWQHWLSCSF